MDTSPKDWSLKNQFRYQNGFVQNLVIIKFLFLISNERRGIFFILHVMIFQHVVVQSYSYIFQLHLKQKVPNHNYLDCELRCTLNWKIHLGLNICIFCVILFKVERIIIQFLVSHLIFYYIFQMHLNYIQKDLSNSKNLKLWFLKMSIPMCFHPSCLAIPLVLVLQSMG